MSVNENQRIIVRAPNWVGDAVMATPFFVSLRATFPQSSITCLCRSLVADFFRYQTAVDQVLELDESEGYSGWRAIRRNALLLRGGEFDLAVSLPNSLSSALIFFLARIPQRVGYRADWRRPLLTRSLEFPPKGQRPHRVEYYLELLKTITTTPVLHRQLVLVVPNFVSASVDSKLKDQGVASYSSFIALAPGAAQPNKMWMSERFAELIDRLTNTERAVVLVGGPQEKGLAVRLCEMVKTKAVFNMVGSGSLLFTAEIIKQAAVFVGNDSGLAHVAAAVGTPSVVLSGPGDQTEVAPYSEQAITIAKELFCKPCYKNYCRREDKPLECLTLISVDEVYSAVLSCLRAGGPAG